MSLGERKEKRWIRVQFPSRCTCRVGDELEPFLYGVRDVPLKLDMEESEPRLLDRLGLASRHIANYFCIYQYTNTVGVL